MHPSLQVLDHRPWPLPPARWRWRQSWLDLGFLHYRVRAGELAGRIPPGLDLQEFDGTAWVSAVPFRMAGVMWGRLPSFPPFSSFPELNLRTYVTDGQKAGVWFFSLDADCAPVVWGGRHIYHLPYFSARMSQRRRGEGFDFTSARRGADVRFEASYAGSGDVFLARPGSFEHWVAERYCLYSLVRGRLTRVEVHHAPWPLRRAEAEVRVNNLLAAAGLIPLDTPPVCHATAGVDVVSYMPVGCPQASRVPRHPS
ncbi:MAG: DUF2071 domain-containing protein [Kiritimatiellia bacterium]